MLELVALMREAIGPDRALIGELYLPIERLMRYYGAGLDLPTNFHLISTPWEAEAIGAHVAAYEDALPDGAWPNYALGNHDRSRIASRAGPAQARVAAVLLLTLRGTPTLYYGDELGLRDVAVPPDRVQDPWERRVPGQGLGRDPVRTPMPWTPEPNAGFCPPEVEPWLPLDPDHARLSVAAQQRDAGLAADALPPAAGAAPRRARARPRLLARAARGRRRARLRPRRALPRGAEPHGRGARARARGPGRRGRPERARDRRRPAVARELRLAGDDAVVVRLG